MLLWGYIMERVHSDMFGPFVKSTRGNIYILMIVDQFKKLVDCHPVPDQTAETLCKVLVDQFFSRFGMPQIIHSRSRAKVWVLQYFRLCRLLDITRTRTSPYRLACKGRVERYNQSVLHIVRSYLHGHDTEWDQFLPLTWMAIRGSTNINTGFTPNFMMLGRELSIPGEAMETSAHHQHMKKKMRWGWDERLGKLRRNEI